MTTAIRIDLSVDDAALRLYGGAFDASDLAESRRMLLEDLAGDPWTWGKRLIRVGGEGVEINVSEVKT